MSEDGCSRGHQDWTQSRARRAGNRLQLTQAGFLQVVREFYDQNSVLRDQTDECNQSYLTVDVQGRETEERERKRARDGQRDRTGQNNEGIAETFKLRREHKIDQNRGKQERAQKFTTFHAQLARLTRVIRSELARIMKGSRKLSNCAASTR